jgi:hypothetical protein
MDGAADSITHSARANIFQHEASWRLGPDALERESGEPGDSARFPHASIVEIRLCFDPTRFHSARHRCAQTATRNRSTAASSTVTPSPGPLGSATAPSPIASGARTTSSAR